MKTLKTMNLVLVCAAMNIGGAAAAEVMSVKSIKDRFEVHGDIFYFDRENGKLVDKGSQTRLWKSVDGSKDKLTRVESYWGTGSSQQGEIALHHLWTIREDGTIRVLIEEYGDTIEVKGSDGERDYKMVNLLKKDEVDLKDFAPVHWVSVRPGAKSKVVIRLTPDLSNSEEPKPLDSIPIAATDLLITDNEGSLWADHLNIDGKYVGFTTHRGSIFLSFYPFKGAQVIGFAAGSKIELGLGNKRIVTLTSSTPFVPETVRAMIYGIHRPNQKTARLQSVRSKSSSTEERFPESLCNYVPAKLSKREPRALEARRRALFF